MNTAFYNAADFVVTAILVFHKKHLSFIVIVESSTVIIPEKIKQIQGKIMAVFIIGDLHLSHGVDKPMDIFPGWSNHTELLKKNWNETVSKEDTVIIPGDVSWGMTTAEALPDLRFINDELNGKKIIMKGNHDYWWQSMKKLEELKSAEGLENISFMFNNAFEVEDFIICGTRGWQIIGDTKSSEDKKIMEREAGRFVLSVAAAKKLKGYGIKKTVAVFHYPPMFDKFVYDRLFDIMLDNRIEECYFGHLHGKISPTAALCEKYHIICKLISADFLKFSPLKLT